MRGVVCGRGRGGRGVCGRRGRGPQLGARPPRVQQRLHALVGRPPPREPRGVLQPYDHGATAPAEVHLVPATHTKPQLALIYKTTGLYC
ncbi:jg7176 [Pararge aegeria aegeria]|uniref:Jg7176 protein n=1 Tax=Pararge aegeria aegeria TaxID=348720 RepID=A0A8S4R984_9NEOP|nr:jg7176 [Pararge aegeria aegeria]